MENEVKEDVPGQIRKEVSKSSLEVSRIYTSDYQKEGTLTAEIKQTITTKSYYPTKSVANNMQDNVFGMVDFKFEEKDFENKEKRVAWIDVPVDSTIDSVKERLSQFPEANLYKVLSNKPVITDSQEYAIENEVTTMEVIAESQIVRFPKDHNQEGEIALDRHGKPQYRSVFFKTTESLDQDHRNSDPQDFYITEALATEIEVVEGVVTGQEI